MAPLGPSIRWCNSLILFAATNRDEMDLLATKFDGDLDLKGQIHSNALNSLGRFCHVVTGVVGGQASAITQQLLLDLLVA